MSELSPSKITLVETPLGGTASLTRTPAVEPAPTDSAFLPRARSLRYVLWQPRHLMRYHYEKVDFASRPSTHISSHDAFHILIVSLSQLIIFLPLRRQSITYQLSERTLLLIWPLVTFARTHIMLHTLWPSPNDGVSLLYKLVVSLFTLLFSLTVPAAFSQSRVITALSAFFIILIPSAILFRNSWYEPLLKDVKNRANQLALIAAGHILVSAPYLAITFVSSTLGVKTLYWAAFAASVFMHFAPHAAFFWLHRGRRRAQTHVPPRLLCNYEGFRMMSHGCFVGACLLLLVHGVDLVQDASIRVTHTYGVAVLSLISLISLHTIHDMDTSPSSHLNPSMIASVSSTFLFAVLHLFVFLSSTACAQLMSNASYPESELTSSTRKLLSVAWACSVLVTTILSAFRTRMRNISRIIRLAVRLVITAALSTGTVQSKVSPIMLMLTYALFLVFVTICDFILDKYESHNVSPFVKNGEQLSSFKVYESSVCGVQLDLNADLSTVIGLLESRNVEGVYPHLQSLKERLLVNDETRLIPIERHDGMNSVSIETASASEADSRPAAVIVLN